MQHPPPPPPPPPAQVSLATDFTWTLNTREANASFGYDYNLRQCRLRGRIDTGGCGGGGGTHAGGAHAAAEPATLHAPRPPARALPTPPLASCLRAHPQTARLARCWRSA